MQVSNSCLVNARRANIPLELSLYSIIGIAACISGCAEQDRILEVECQARNGALSFRLSKSEAADATAGSFNRRQDALGSILRISASDSRETGSALVYKLGKFNKTNVHLPFWARGVYVPLTVKSANDLQSLPDPASHAKIQSALSTGMQIIALDVTRESIIGVLDAINGDPKALRVLQEAPTKDTIVVVSTKLHTAKAALSYYPAAHGLPSAPFVAVQTLQFENIHFHINYSCPAIRSIKSSANSSGPYLTALYLYTAVTYNSETKRAQIDPRGLTFNMLNAIS